LIIVLLLEPYVKLMPTRLAGAVPNGFFGGNPPFSEDQRLGWEFKRRRELAEIPKT
jgi:hypothetical protein